MSKKSAIHGFETRKKLRYEPPSFVFQPVRTRLLDTLLLDTKNWPKTLSIVAPIGYGKTVLMSELFIQLKRSGAKVLWFGLDDRNADLESLLETIEAGLGHISKEVDLPRVLLPGYE